MVEALQHQHNDSAVFYGRVQLPSISIAIVDSVKVRGPDLGSGIPHITSIVFLEFLILFYFYLYKMLNVPIIIRVCFRLYTRLS